MQVLYMELNKGLPWQKQLFSSSFIPAANWSWIWGRK